MRAWTALAALAAAAAPAAAKADTAVLAGGCFWGVEAVFEHVKGVSGVVSGYAGGAAGDATYAKVSSERTGHAEAVRISFDPRKVSYADLLRIYFTVAHDPGQLNRQGPDVGPSYRSAIFPQNAAQRSAAVQAISALKAKRKVATRIESGAFYSAEPYHQ
ncbi:MAG TPA: peptide-methionine (S)-S-oxide reductase MsrA, partial [Allosphingosinicella sp.]